MADAGIEQVRSFNRTVTQRIGVLQDEYLARARPLGASRMLWEIGDGADVRSLRARLDLDSGYVSRVLGALSDEGLVRVEASRADKRVRTARLTAKGRRERALLDRRSDDLATSLLEPLNDPQRRQLLDAMKTVERLLTAGLVQVAAEDPGSDDAQACLTAYFTELDTRFDIGFDPAQSRPLPLDEMRAPKGLMLIARLHGEPIGCGGLKFHGRKAAEIKRMWVDTSARGLGVGRRLLTELEQRAREHGAPAVQLDTNKTLKEAIAMYQSSGYERIDAFNDEPYATHWFEKRLPARVRRGRPVG
jgi:DNA-binding MarR family transcriptional regulator/GNAT superfamily N-acetyltransferase